MDFAFGSGDEDSGVDGSGGLVAGSAELAGAGAASEGAGTPAAALHDRGDGLPWSMATGWEGATTVSGAPVLGGTTGAVVAAGGVPLAVGVGDPVPAGRSTITGRGPFGCTTLASTRLSAPTTMATEATTHAAGASRRTRSPAPTQERNGTTGPVTHRRGGRPDAMGQLWAPGVS